MYGLTYKTQTPLGDAFITINKDSQGNPFEAFITIGKSGSDIAAMADALGRMISLALRLQSPVSARERVRQIVGQLSGIGGMRTVGFGENRVRSVPDAVAKVFAEIFGFAVNGLIKDTKPVFSQNGPTELNGSSVQNGAAGVNNGEAKALGAVLIKGEDTPQKNPGETVVMEQLSISADVAGSGFDLCPSCGQASLAHEEGCKKCYSCGYSEC